MAGSTKTMLPLLSYTFGDGPFRDTHVRFGYDPRKDPKARLYDFHVESLIAGYFGSLSLKSYQKVFFRDHFRSGARVTPGCRPRPKGVPSVPSMSQEVGGASGSRAPGVSSTYK
jgi:hypothetical protein